MHAPASSDPARNQRQSAFATTLWTEVITAGASASPQAEAALETLCRSYWYPLYAWARRQGFAAPDAEDLVQGFFEVFLAKEYLKDADRSRGRFRSFLLASLKHYAANQRDRAQARKRGGRVHFVPLDSGEAETRYGKEPLDVNSADRIYERRWAMTVLERALQRLREECTREGKADLFEHLKETLVGDPQSLPYAQIGEKLGISEGTVKVAAHRLRRRYRLQVRSEIAGTVDSEDEVETELRHLTEVLRE